MQGEVAVGEGFELGQEVLGDAAGGADDGQEDVAGVGGGHVAVVWWVEVGEDGSKALHEVKES